MSKRLPVPLLISALGLMLLPPVLLALGLTMTSATEVVVYAIACMALNILVGHTGLVSFGHGAWFGLAAYAAALIQRNLMTDSFFGPTIAGVLIVSVLAAAFGFLILRRDRKSTRLNSSHRCISYAVFCLKKKKTKKTCYSKRNSMN